MAASAQTEQAQGQEQLARGRIGRRSAHQAPQHGLAPVPVDRTTVVGVDEGAEGQLVALVDVGDAGHGELEHELPVGGAVAGHGQVAHEGPEVVAEALVAIQLGDEARHGLLPLLVAVHPGGVALGLAQRLLHVGLHTLLLDRPRSGQGLEDEVALEVVGRAVLAQVLA